VNAWVEPTHVQEILALLDTCHGASASLECNSCMHSFVRSFVRSFVHAVVHSFVCLFVHSYVIRSTHVFRYSQGHTVLSIPLIQDPLLAVSTPATCVDMATSC